jgi:hypothetical protein
MKTKFRFISILLLSIFSISIVSAQNQNIRDVGAFSKISLRIPATLHLTQDNIQEVRVVAKKNNN